MIGGDSKNNMGYVTSNSSNLDLFVRYGNFIDSEGKSTLSTEDGKISMPDLRQYKIVDDGEGVTVEIEIFGKARHDARLGCHLCDSACVSRGDGFGIG